MGLAPSVVWVAIMSGDQREDLYAAGGIGRAVCRGSMALGSGCGKCSRCLAEPVPAKPAFGCGSCDRADECARIGCCTKPVTPLHRPLDGDGVFKGRLAHHALPAVPAGAVGWVCPTCGTPNAPTQPGCFACAKFTPA